MVLEFPKLGLPRVWPNGIAEALVMVMMCVCVCVCVCARERERERGDLLQLMANFISDPLEDS